MYAFLDESGDLGFDFSKTKPSSYFVLALLLCDDEKVAKQIRIAIKKL